MKRLSAVNFSIASATLLLLLSAAGCKASPTETPAQPASAPQPAASAAAPAAAPAAIDPALVASAPTLDRVTGDDVMKLTQQFLAVAPKRYIGSSGHAAAEKFIRDHFAPEAAHGQFEADQFSPNTPIGQLAMTNYIVRYPGKKDGVIVIASHYETNYPLKDIGFVGANDGACTTALLIALGEYFRAHPPQGYSVWLVFDDGEEAVQSWTASDSLYGTRHLAAKWSGDGTLNKIKAVLIADMIGDKDLNIDYVDNSTPWLLDMLKVAAHNTGHAGSIYKYKETEDDDHLPFVSRGVPALDILDAHYGPATPDSPDGYHHTAQDTIDKISAHSLQISSDLILEMVKLINQK
jgi:glutaminyl-peptide cyclotransferase